jgi:hypothetical protein
VDVEVDGWGGEQDPGQPAEQEGDHDPDAEQHRGGQTEGAAPHGADPVEELDTGGYRDEEGGDREEGQQHRASGEHVVCPDHDGQSGDRDGGEYWDDLADDPEAVGRVEHVRADQPVGE